MHADAIASLFSFPVRLYFFFLFVNYVVCTQDAASQHLVAAWYVKSVSSHIYFWAGLGWAKQ
jgi:hypothetical protein